MSGKRGASSDLNHDNWDRDEDVEDAGTFTKASDDVLKRRVIKTAKRRNAQPQQTSTGNGEDANKSVFGGFKGFSAFAPPNPNSAFSFLANTNTTSLKSPQTPIANGVESKSDKTEETADKSNGDPEKTEYYAKLKGLNESVLSWIEKHVKENPFINLKPIFADYDRYLTDLDVKHVTVSENTKKELTTFSFKPSPSTTNNSVSAFSKPSQSFAFGGPDASKDKTTIEKDKDKEKEKPQATFVFGSANASKSKPTTGTGETKKTFNFASAAKNPGTSLFANSTPMAFAPVTTKPASQTTSQQNECEDATDGDEPPKVDFTPVVEKDNIYTIKCKVFVKKDGNFGDRGVGNMYLKRVPDSEKVQLIVRADTNLGNLLCNFILSEAVPTQRMGKKDVMLVCIPLPDAQPPPVPVLLRVKSTEDADALLKELEKHKK